LDHLLCHNLYGTYIDFGANDPDYLNNTRRFFERGCRGIHMKPILICIVGYCAAAGEDFT
jgi:hypothetical protein